MLVLIWIMDREITWEFGKQYGQTNSFLSAWFHSLVLFLWSAGFVEEMNLFWRNKLLSFLHLNKLGKIHFVSVIFD